MPGEEDARVAFCRHEFPRLVGTLTLYCGDADVAAELAQEALARACHRWGRVAAMEHPRAWLHRVGINLANRHYRRRAGERAAVQRAAARVVAVTEDHDLAEVLAVRAAVASLPSRQRTALVLRYYGDLPVRQVAEIMGCREGTVRALTAQAVARLRGEPGLLGEAEEARDGR